MPRPRGRIALCAPNGKTLRYIKTRQARDLIANVLAEEVDGKLRLLELKPVLRGSRESNQARALSKLANEPHPKMLNGGLPDV
jgi:hypothetical protein